MGKDKKNILLSFITNTYVKNILLMAIIAVAIVAGVLWWLSIYTRHSESVNVPDLKGMQVQDADALVLSSQLKYDVVDSIYQKGGTPGSILEQIPAANSKVKKGRTIYLTIQSLNEPMIAVPDLEDASLRQAQTILSSLGFNNVEIKYIPSEYRDLVYSIEYKNIKLKVGQKIPKGALITINVGDGGSSEIPSDTISEDNSAIEENF